MGALFSGLNIYQTWWKKADFFRRFIDPYSLILPLTNRLDVRWALLCRPLCQRHVLTPNTIINTQNFSFTVSVCVRISLTGIFSCVPVCIAFIVARFDGGVFPRPFWRRTRQAPCFQGIHLTGDGICVPVALKDYLPLVNLIVGRGLPSSGSLISSSSFISAAFALSSTSRTTSTLLSIPT